jgi:transketolase
MDKPGKISMLKQKAVVLRETALTMIYTAQSGHPGGSLSAADIVAALYFDELNLDPKNPKWPERDRFVLSKGHTCPILYSALIMRGFMPPETVQTLRKYHSVLQGHPDMKKTPGVDISTGSLGQGLSCATGMALGLKRDKSKARVFALVGDGECNEGIVWEAAETAVKYELDNLVVFVDYNGAQNDGWCKDIMPTQSLEDKFKAFGCDVYSIESDIMEEIVDVLDKLRGLNNGKPHVVIGHTKKGRGVSFMEIDPSWHGRAPNDDEYKRAMVEIKEGLK